jgi:hypothetical protein
MPKFDYKAYRAGEGFRDARTTIIKDVQSYQTYLTAAEYVEAGLAYLEAQLRLARTSANGSLRKILSNELADKEVRCGMFRPGVNLYYQVLSDDAFNHLATQRMQFKDVGAGFVHGEYTHRIQWYVGMYHQTRGFGENGYKTPDGSPPRKHAWSPSGLFKNVTLFGSSLDQKYWPARQVSGGGNLWDSLFDRNSNHVTAEDGITSPEAFNKSLFDPETIKASKLPTIGLGFSGIGTRAAAYPTLSEIVTARYLKRTGGIKPETNEKLIEYATWKFQRQGSRYTTLVNPEKDEALEIQLSKGVLVPRTGSLS